MPFEYIKREKEEEWMSLFETEQNRNFPIEK